MQRGTYPTFLATSAIYFSLACSAGQTEPTAPGPTPDSETEASRAPDSTASAAERLPNGDAPPNPASGNSSAPPEGLPPMAGAPLKASEMGARLLELGLDPMKLPALSELSPKQRFKVMPLLAESLGVECTGCHEGKNYRAETSQKKVARFMWNTMTAPHQLSEGPLFCDSCHQGSLENLDRNHPQGVEAYMKAEYAGRLLRTSDGNSASCATCHGDDFEPDILDHLP